MLTKTLVIAQVLYPYDNCSQIGNGAVATARIDNQVVLGNSSIVFA